MAYEIVVLPLDPVCNWKFKDQSSCAIKPSNSLAVSRNGDQPVHIGNYCQFHIIDAKDQLVKLESDGE